MSVSEHELDTVVALAVEDVSAEFLAFDLLVANSLLHTTTLSSLGKLGTPFLLILKNLPEFPWQPMDLLVLKHPLSER